MSKHYQLVTIPLDTDVKTSEHDINSLPAFLQPLKEVLTNETFKDLEITIDKTIYFLYPVREANNED